VGLVPENWTVKSIGSILNKGKLGGNYSNQDKETHYPLIKMGNIGRGSIDLGKIEYISDGIITNEMDRMRYGGLLFNTRNTLDLVGKVAIWRNELPIAYFNSNLMRLDLKPEEIASTFYANYAFNSTGCIARLKSNCARPPRPKGRGMLRAARPVFRNSEIIQS
jgi:type I restriction enzyme S subunit